MRYLLLQDTAGRALLKKEKLFYILIAVFFITFYFPDWPVVNNIAIGLLSLCCFFYNSLAEKWRLLRQRPAVTVMLLFCILHIISALVSENRQQAIGWLQLRSPLLLFPLAIGLIDIRPGLKDRVFLLYAVLTTIAAMICIGYAYGQFRQTGNVGLLYNDSLTTAIGKQSVYFALMINLAIIFYSYLLITQPLIQRRKAWVFTAIAFLLIIQFLLASRMEITFLLISSMAFAVYYFFIRHKKIAQGVSLFAGLLITAVLLGSFFPKTINRFKEILYPQYAFNSNAIESHYNGQLSPDQWNGMNIRLAIWQCGWELSRQHPLFGVSVGDKEDALMAMYKEKDFDFAIRTKKNMHNNYLDLLASMGITGLLLFLAGFLVLPLLSCIKKKDVPGALVLTALMASLITETYIDRSMGCVIFAFFVSFITACHQSHTAHVTGYPPGTA